MLDSGPLAPAEGVIEPDASAIELDDVTGAPFSLAEVDEPIVVMKFWASWCGFCRASLLLLHTFRDWVDQEQKPVEVLTVNVSETAATAQNAWTQLGHDLPIVMDPYLTAFRAYARIYKVTGIPYTVVVAGGKIAAHYAGYNRLLVQDLQDDVADLEPLVAIDRSGPLRGDLDADGSVGSFDLTLVLNHWSGSVPPADPRADPSGDHRVNSTDLAIVMNDWASSAPPAAAAAAFLTAPLLANPMTGTRDTNCSGTPQAFPRPYRRWR